MISKEAFSSNWIGRVTVFHKWEIAGQFSQPIQVPLPSSASLLPSLDRLLSSKTPGLHQQKCYYSWLQALPGKWPTLFCTSQGSHQSCLSLQSLRLPGRCRDSAVATQGPCCWPCCCMSPWKYVVHAWRATGARISPRKRTWWYVGHCKL